MEHKDIKDFGKLIGEFITRYMTMIRCATQQCSKEIIKAAADKDLIEKYSKFNLEQHKPTKIKMLFELSDNSIMYDINICAVKNCKKFVKDVLKSFDSYLTLLPKNSPIYNILNTIITKLKKMVNSKKPLTEKQYKNNIKEIKDLIKTLN